MALSTKYQHRPLSAGKNIRVLVLEPAWNLNAPVNCSLQELCIEGLESGEGQYEALSYCWGSIIRTEPITCEGKTLFVTRNCQDALRHLRFRWRQRILFVDAICIDQSLENEKIHQVQLMGQIYASAAQVLVWLGAGDPVAERFMRGLVWLGRLLPYCNETITLGAYRVLYRYYRCSPDFKALEDSGQEGPLPLDCFTRVWTLQESLVAHRTIVVYALQQMKIEKFGMMSAQYAASNSRDRELPTMLLSIDLTAKMIKHHVQAAKSSEIARSLVSLGQPLPERNPIDEDWPWNKDPVPWILGDLFMMACCRSSTKPLDHVYGLYGLCTILGIDLATPDYQKTPEQAFEEYTVAFIRRSRTLRIWGMMNLDFCNPDWPSWVPDIGRKYEMEDRIFIGAKYKTEDILQGQKYISFRPVYELNYSPGILRLEGVIRGPVTPFHTRNIMKMSTVPKNVAIEPDGLAWIEWINGLLSKADRLQPCPNGDGAVDAFQSFLCANPQMRAEDSSLHRRFIALLGSKTQNFREGKIPLAKLAPGFDVKLDQFIKLMTRVYSMCADMLPFTMSDGCVGMAYAKEIQEEDLVVYFYGCQVPMMIRADGSNYRLLGRARVGGLEDGFFPLREDREDVQLITLV